MSPRTVVPAANTASTTARPASRAVAAAKGSGEPPLIVWPDWSPDKRPIRAALFS